ncbi:hypothetical protein OIV83_002060 [Microbotryomycetes sp. JL201]|nr:hypothetical protein OIV83_002060 [Microbotryomycetes sp. JL201]
MNSSVYRGAVVEDLQLSPALVLPSTTRVSDALQMAYEREFTILPISDPSTRTLIGWLNSDVLKTQYAKGLVKDDQTLSQVDQLSRGTDSTSTTSASVPAESAQPTTLSVRKFRKDKIYQLITPDTALEDLEQFFATSKSSFALVTDHSRKFVLGVVTPEDLQKFVSRRNPGAAKAASAA